jgi:diguanylate cyclase (GGDEF)-like protein
MPRMDGLKVCRHLKEADVTRDIPILFLTVDANVENLARALDCGGADYILKPFNEIDLAARVRVALRSKRMLDLLKEQARIDALTGLANRAAFDSSLASAVATWERAQHPFALLMFDLDHFKQVNDAHGHGVGDDLLRAVGTRLQSCCRPYDTPCRFGGDEFVVILGQVQGSQALGASLRLLEAVRGATCETASARIAGSCSAGLATVADLAQGFRAEDLVDAADAALYRAKRDGRDRLCTAAGESHGG